MAPDGSVPGTRGCGFVVRIAGRRIRASVPTRDVKDPEICYRDGSAPAARERVLERDDEWDHPRIAHRNVRIQTPVVRGTDISGSEARIHSVSHLPDLASCPERYAVGRRRRIRARLAWIPIYRRRAAVDDVVSQGAAAAGDRTVAAPVDELQEDGRVRGVRGHLETAEHADADAEVRRSEGDRVSNPGGAGRSLGHLRVGDR